MSKSVTIYTSDTCGSCKMVKQYLQLKGLDYSEVNITSSPERRDELVAISGQMMVPVTVVEDGEGAKDITVGYNLGKLSSAIA